MKIKTKTILRRSLWLLVSLTVFITLLSLWIAEPYHHNPFIDLPPAYSNSIVKITCDDEYSETFKLKADSILNSAMNLNDFMGISTGISTQECGHWISTAGYKNKKHGSEADRKTLFRLASVSKPFTAVAIMQLVENGSVKLDERIQTYIPNYPVSPKGEITIRQLLNHTSGVVHYNSVLTAVSFKHYENLNHALDKFKDEELVFAPGSNYLYSTYGYTVLGAIVEKVTGLSYQDYMDTYIWKPSKMFHTSIEDQNLSYENKAHLYINFKNRFIKSPNTDLSVKYPGGGIHSTAEDMLKFGQAIINNKLIDSTSLETMMAIEDNIAKKGSPYGLGWFIESNEKDGRILQHGGSQSGTSTFFRVYLDKKIVVVSLANSFESNDETYFLSQELADLILDSTPFRKPINYFRPLSKKVLRSMVGKFKNVDKEEFFHFTLQGNQLYAELKPYPKLPVYPSSDNRFYYRHFDGKLIFSENKGVQGQRLEYYYKGELNVFERIK